MTSTKENVLKIKALMEAKGLYLDDVIIMKLFLALQYRGKGISTVLLNGAPGAGKTSLVETLAEILNAHLEMYSGVPTTSEEALIFDIDVAATVARDAANINKKGKLVKAIEAAESKYSILFLDEWEKTRPEMDSFLLDFLQSGRLTGTPLGDIKLKNIRQLLVFIAKNNERELSEPLIRRCRVLYLPLPRPEKVRQILYSTCSNSCKFMTNWIVRLYTKQYEEQEKFRKVTTIQEMTNALLDDNLMVSEYSEDERKENALGWMVQYEDDIDRMNNIAKVTPFKMSARIYEELGANSADFIDTTTVMRAFIRNLTPEYVNKRRGIVVWAAMWYLAQAECADKLTKVMTFKDICNKVKNDYDGNNTEKRIRSFFDFYANKDFAYILTIAPDFIDSNGNKIKVTKEILYKND